MITRDILAAARVDIDKATDQVIVGSDDWTGFSASQAQTRVRGGGIGSNAWVARLNRLGDKNAGEYEFDRSFMDSDRSGLSRSGRSGEITWEVTGVGVYEFGRFAASSSYPVSGYFVILSDNTVIKITKHEVKRLLKALAATETTTAAA